MNRKTVVVIVVSALAAAGWLAWAFAPRPVPVETAIADRGRFESTIDEDGRTRVRDRHVVTAPLAGRLTRITLHEGDPVAAGAVVATLLPTLSPLLDERTVRSQQARVEGAEAAVRRAAAQAEHTRVAVRQARNELERSEELAQRGFVAPTKLETDRLALAAARRMSEAAEQDRQIAQHELEQTRAALGAVRQSSAAPPFEVRSPIDGRVLKVLQPSESTIGLGTPLLELGDTRRLEIVAELLTTEALRARPGDRVSIERWGGPQVLSGTVRRIEPAAFTKVSALGVEEQRVNVLIDLSGPQEAYERLGDGYRVAVRIVVLSVDDAVRVPVGAVFPLPPLQAEDPTPRFAVFTLRDGRARLAPVDVGARNGTHAWIRSGLQPGQPVIVYPSAAVRDAVRVSAPAGSAGGIR
jgi:HlyD family secretion protein